MKKLTEIKARYLQAEQDLIAKNNLTLQANRIHKDDLKELLQGAGMREGFEIEIVDEPQGDDQCERFGIWHNTWVDQWSVGDSGDSFEGFIYGQLPDKRWLKVAYYC